MNCSHITGKINTGALKKEYIEASTEKSNILQGTDNPLSVSVERWW
jgi:hypothetical protein